MQQKVTQRELFFAHFMNELSISFVTVLVFLPGQLNRITGSWKMTVDNETLNKLINRIDSLEREVANTKEENKQLQEDVNILQREIRKLKTNGISPNNLGYVCQMKICNSNLTDATISKRYSAKNLDLAIFPKCLATLLLSFKSQTQGSANIGQPDTV